MASIDNEINDILLKIFNQKNIGKYTEYRLKTHIDIAAIEIKNLIVSLNVKSHVKAYYNKKTMNCDSIGVVDVDGTRMIDFNDDYCDMMNKGLDFMIIGTEF